jgi:MFS family permease
MIKRREKEARAVLAGINGSADIEDAISDIKRTITDERGGSFSELMQPQLRAPLAIGIGLMLIQQLTGINTVIYYAPTIFEMAGFTSDTVAISATIGVGVVNVLMTVVSIWLIDRIGRKTLLSVGLIGMTISLIVLGLAFFGASKLGETTRWVTVWALLVYVASSL